MKNNSLTTKDTFGNTRTYEITESIPAGFFVWNIGKNMGHEEYIPICELLYPDLPKSNPESCYINPETVKAIKLTKEETAILRDAAGYGVTSKKAAESAIKRIVKSTMQKRKKMLAEKALPILEKITT